MSLRKKETCLLQWCDHCDFLPRAVSQYLRTLYEARTLNRKYPTEILILHRWKKHKQAINVYLKVKIKKSLQFQDGSG